MNRVTLGFSAAALIAAAGAGLMLVRGPTASNLAVAPAAAQGVAAPIYYQDPDGKPYYSPTPRKTGDGRDYRAVFPNQDINFDEAETNAMPMPAPAAGGGERKIKFYRNPMGLPDTSPTPKKDSMGMDYIPVYSGDESEDGSVKLSPGKIQRTGVKSEPAANRVIRTTIRAPGTIQIDERRVSVISMRSESWIQKVANVTTGAKVTKGQPLMEVYSAAVSAAAAEYIATIDSKTTGNNGPYKGGSRQRLMNLNVPEEVIAAIERARAAPLAIAWSAPRDGVVLERNAIEGMRAQPGDVLFKVADISVVWAMADVAERDLGAMAIGQPAIVKARSFPGRDFVGKISVIYPQVNRETRTARVRIELANADLVLLPDMYVDAVIDTGKQEPVLAVPESAILDTGSRQAVFIDKGEGRFEPRDVKLGHRGGGYVEIRDGIRNGDPVVISANFLIDAESNLKSALQGFSAAGDQQ